MDEPQFAVNGVIKLYFTSHGRKTPQGWQSGKTGRGCGGILETL